MAGRTSNDKRERKTSMKNYSGEEQYLNLLKDILRNGVEKHEFNTGIMIKSVFGRQIRFDLSQGFPLLTTKKVFIKGIIYELLWFLRGDSNIKYLVDHNVHIWDDWAYKKYKMKNAVPDGRQDKLKMDKEKFIQKIAENDVFAKKWGELGPVYGKQWRKWKTSDGREVDQIAWAIAKLKKTPDRKHIVISAWNPEYIYEMASSGQSMALPPCHTLFQLNVADNKLSCQLYQRSADFFLGVPFNIASYALLTMIIAHIAGFQYGDFIHTFGDAHIYSNHFDQVQQQLKRSPRPFPKMILNQKVTSINDFTYEDFILKDYNPHPTIKGAVTVVGGF